MTENKFKNACLDLINLIRDDGVRFIFLNKKSLSNGEDGHYFYNSATKKHTITIAILSPYIFNKRLIWKKLFEYLTHEVSHYLREKYLLNRETKSLVDKANTILYSKTSSQKDKINAAKIVAYDEVETDKCAVEIIKQYNLWDEYKNDFWFYARRYLSLIKNIPYGGSLKDTPPIIYKNTRITKKEIFENARIKS